MSPNRLWYFMGCFRTTVTNATTALELVWLTAVIDSPYVWVSLRGYRSMNNALLFCSYNCFY